MRGRPVAREFLPIIDWVNHKAVPNGPALSWKIFKTPQEAKVEMKRLWHCLRGQVRLPPGVEFKLRRSFPDPNSERTEVFIWLYTEPKEIVRLPQGTRHDLHRG